MRKLFCALILSATTLFCACTHCRESEDQKSWTARASFSYGLPHEETASLLLGGMSVPFDIEDFGISALVAGDEVTIWYEGEIMMLETFPGKFAGDYTILDVTVEPASVLELVVMQNPGGGVSIKPKAEGMSVSKHNFPNCYVVMSSGYFKPLDESFLGKTLYGTYVAGKSSIELEGLYDHHPRRTAEQTHTCAHVCLQEIEPTCQTEGRSVIGCTFCGDVYEDRVLPTVDCQPDENGNCIWCKTA